MNLRNSNPKYPQMKNWYVFSNSTQRKSGYFHLNKNQFKLMHVQALWHPNYIIVQRIKIVFDKVWKLSRINKNFTVQSSPFLGNYVTIGEFKLSHGYYDGYALQDNASKSNENTPMSIQNNNGTYLKQKKEIKFSTSKGCWSASSN